MHAADKDRLVSKLHDYPCLNMDVYKMDVYQEDQSKQNTTFDRPYKTGSTLLVVWGFDLIML